MTLLPPGRGADSDPFGREPSRIVDPPLRRVSALGSQARVAAIRGLLLWVPRHLARNFRSAMPATKRASAQIPRQSAPVLLTGRHGGNRAQRVPGFRVRARHAPGRSVIAGLLGTDIITISIRVIRRFSLSMVASADIVRP